MLLYPKNGIGDSNNKAVKVIRYSRSALKDMLFSGSKKVPYISLNRIDARRFARVGLWIVETNIGKIATASIVSCRWRVFRC